MSLDDLQAQLRGALDQQFAALKQQYERQVAETRQQALLEAQRAAEARIAQVKEQTETVVDHDVKVTLLAERWDPRDAGLMW